MIRRYMTLLKAAMMVCDGLSAAVLFPLVYLVRFPVDSDPVAGQLGAVPVLGLAAAYGLLWVGSLWVQGLYRLRTHWSLRGEVVDVLRASALVAVSSLSALYILKLNDVSRVFLLMLFVAQPIVTVTSRVALRLVLASMRSRGLLSRQMLIIGAGAEADRFADEVENHRELGLTVIGHLIGPRDEPGGVRRPVIGSLDDIEKVLHRRVVDEVGICLSPEDWVYVEPTTRICEEEGKIVRVSIRSLGGVLTGGRYEELAGIPLVTFLYGPDRVMGMAAKRAFDLLVSATLLILLSPLLLAIAVYLRIREGHPILFRQERVGLHGRTFPCLKFRTMVPDAEERLAEVAHLNQVRGPAFKMADDPRVTRSGPWLRRTGLDELPQLFNVLRGQMSIVGPRPAPQREVELYSVWHRRRLSMRPGLTGLWQVQARGDPDFDRRATLDLRYIDGWSLWTDLKILLRTIVTIVHADGR